MSTTRPAAPPARSRTRAAVAIAAAIVAVLVIAFFVFSGFYSDVLWFDQLGFLGVLTTRWASQAVMFGVGFVAMAFIVWLSIALAFRARPVYAKLNSQLDRYQQVIEPLRKVAMIGIPLVLGLFMGVSTATRWETVQQFLYRTPFGEVDAQFGLDIAFYVYELPLYRGVVAYASAVVLIAGLAALATSYIYGGIQVTGREVRITRRARIQLAITAAIYIALQGLSIWLDQYATLTDQKDILTGVSYADDNARIPGLTILAGIAAIVAVLCIVTAIIGRWRLPLIGTALLIIAGLVVGSIYPAIVDRLQVQPSAGQLEAPYIERNIDATRQAYGIADVDVQQYDAQSVAEPGALREDAETTANIRILDPARVSPTFAQLERVRQYYQFQSHLDVDRYTIDGNTQDTVIAVRELNQDADDSWYNNALVYTHGYGVVAAYGNQRDAQGQPQFLESGIPSTGELGEYEPRVYFGENSPAYSIVGGPEGADDDIEIDYPSGSTESNAYTTFTGDGGPQLGGLFTRLVYAIKFGAEEILLSEQVNDSSQILYDRNPIDRVKNVAPYLTVDSDAYPAVVDGRILWIVDGYTTTASYPYSHVQSLSGAIVDSNTPAQPYAIDDINYIRNSVKATVDAYDGTVTLYAWDEEDPILKTWEAIYPGTITPKSEMSDELLAHVRYPADLFKVQRSVLATYHITNPIEFYSRTDAWTTPDDPTETATEVAQPPYYLTMQLPGTEAPAFTLYSTYIPRTSGESQNILTGYLAVNSDAGEDYGKLTLLTLPKDNTVPAPGQVQNQFDSDPVVGRDLNLLSQGGSEVQLGNLLTLPVGGGLLYVQPVYVQSSGGTQYPLLRKVLVAFGDEIAFEDTLDAALDALFGGDSGADAGDGDVPTDPTDPTEPTEPTDPGTLTELQQALADYQTALAAREAAYARNDLVAAAQADEDMQDAIERAIAAAEAG
ncbi:UPF0182 family protein [Pseudolysinimonas yzui]|uniref:UPF0182 protein GCM10011600_16950 n=1 Tax=Pseudolysinimonas yzui TaxID=2708254 RepID=A0A8J3M186_9MICO|nr:UPF0182 family protein [Pseudolysinimonas yzui]GHF16451.1 UPF0182 protein [Pseudolysinimonas yzui]